MTNIQNFSFTGHQDNARTVGRKRQSFVIILLFSLIMFGGVIYRLAYLQLVQGEANQLKAENNRIRIVPKQPVRGNIFDRKGKVLATTRLSHSLYVWPMAQKKPGWATTLHRLSTILDIPQAEIEQKVAEAGYDSPTLVRIVRDLTPKQITFIEESANDLQGVQVDVETIRYYPHKELGSHILGYTGELNAEELEKLKPEGYRLGDIVGKMGVEEAYENNLRGEWGGLELEVDGAGRVQRVLGQKPPQAGEDLTLGLDLELQKSAQAALKDRKGGVVALDPRDGKILAMVSYPRFDPNIFSARITPEIWKKLQGKGNPFVNRAMRGFPPASTFKVVTATAGMESGKYPPNTILNTFAYLNVGGTSFGEWNRAGFGPMGYVRAMAWSSNTFHGQIGRGVGGLTLIDWARRYGFGSKTGIELTGEAPGLIADDAWKRKNYNWAWTDGDTVNMSIGQGFTQATPLQIAVMFAVPANGGYKVKPHMLNNVPDINQYRTSMNLKPSTVKTLREGLRAVVTAGTGKALNVPEIPSAAGKSGTAEAPPGKNHTWFGAFAPFDKPEIVVVAFVEHSGGGGGSTAGPIVQQVMRTYFHKSKPKPSK